MTELVKEFDMTEAITGSARDYIAERVEIQPDGCWRWKLCLTPGGYGMVRLRSRGVMTGAHRYSYEAHVGPIPDGLVLDHLCRNRACVNPDHLEPVTHAENLARGEGRTFVAARNEACTKGHRVEGDNVYVSPEGLSRCRTCMRETRAARWQKDKAARGVPDRKAASTCHEPNCDRVHYGKGLCKKHYQRMYYAATKQT